MSDPAFPWSIRVRERIWLNDEAFALTCSRPDGFTFQAGQHVNLGHEGLEREYTLTSGPDAPELRFLVKRVRGGQMSEALARIEPGRHLVMSRAKGYLIFHPTHRPAVLVGTGVGVAPFVAMTAAGLNDCVLIQGARTASSLFYRRELSAANRHVACLSGPDEDCSAARAFPGRVTAWVAGYLPRGAFEFYLCGSRDMIRDMTHLLDRSFPHTVIHSEAYD